MNYAKLVIALRGRMFGFGSSWSRKGLISLFSPLSIRRQYEFNRQKVTWPILMTSSIKECCYKILFIFEQLK